MPAIGSARSAKWQARANSICYSDDQMLVGQHVYGIPIKSAPLLHLQRTEDSDITAAFSEAFETA
jgi:hypothetical protein